MKPHLWGILNPVSESTPWGTCAVVSSPKKQIPSGNDRQQNWIHLPMGRWRSFGNHVIWAAAAASDCLPGR
jgi:hypothetical protein